MANHQRLVTESGQLAYSGAPRRFPGLNAAMTATPPTTAPWTIAAEPVDSPAGRAVLREYVADVVGAYYGRPATEDEVDLEFGDGGADLRPPTGAFLVGRRGGVVGGCVGVRAWRPGIAELKRLYVRPALRGSGGAALLVAAAEERARAMGARALRLDTRSDLVAARGLYARLGYREIPAYNDEPYADHWFEKVLR